MADYEYQGDGVTPIFPDEPESFAIRTVKRFPLVCGRAEMSDGEPRVPETLAFTMDGSSYRGELLVSADFGCVQWEAK